MSEADIHEHIARLFAKLQAERAAQAIEAPRAETVKQGSVEDESAVGNADAPTIGDHNG